MPIDYQIIDNTIVLKSKPESPKTVVINQQQEPLRLTGTVKDKNGNPLQAAAVIDKRNNHRYQHGCRRQFYPLLHAESKVLR